MLNYQPFERKYLSYSFVHVYSMEVLRYSTKLLWNTIVHANLMD